MFRSFAFVLAAGIALAGLTSVAFAAPVEHVCTNGKPHAYQDETIACYSDTGCQIAQKLGGEPIRNYEVRSAPFALARGKIAAIVTSSPALIRAVQKVGGTCKMHRG